MIKEFEKLSPQKKEFVNSVIKSLMKEPTPEEKERRRQEQERIEDEKNFRELKAKCETMTAEDYRRELNEIFEHLECYKLRFFYIFIVEKLRS